MQSFLVRKYGMVLYINENFHFTLFVPVINLHLASQCSICKLSNLSNYSENPEIIIYRMLRT